MIGPKGGSQTDFSVTKKRKRKREEMSLFHPKVSYKSELGKQSLKLIILVH